MQGAITVPIGAAAGSGGFLGSLASTGNVFKAIGTAAASVTGPADAAVTPLINNDVFLVVPKAFHALDVAVVEAFNVGGAVLTPGSSSRRSRTGAPTFSAPSISRWARRRPRRAPRTYCRSLAVAAVDVTTAVAFQAGELLLAGAVQITDAAAQELAQSGDPAAALAAGATRAGQVVNAASAPVVSAVDTAVTNIRNSLADPFPSAATMTAPSVQTLTVKAAEPKAEAKKTDPPTTEKASESPRGDKGIGSRDRHEQVKCDDGRTSSIR